MRSIFFALILTIATLASPAQAQNPLFVADIDFAPYSMISEGKPAGIDVDVLTEAARRSNLNLDIQFKQLDKLIEMVKTGQCDGAFSLFRSPEREKYAMFMEAVPVHYSDYVLFTKVGDKFSFSSYADLTGKIIGKVDGVSLGEEFDAAKGKGTVEVKLYPDPAAALKGLLMGEIDAYAGNIDVTYHRLKTMGMTSSIVYLPKKIVSQKPAYLVMSRASKLENKELILQKLERALDLMRKDGTYGKIARRYLLRY
ncbi:transporter substrate-binding domain-containing protein [Pseudodesulfovibrio sp.]|nr:transporter substrate-binding domain-containing protein [Pseudodesulfovibrio sp.]